MMHTRFIIQMTIPTRPDLNYFYKGQGKEDCSIFSLTKSAAKRYYFLEEADRDMRILAAKQGDGTFKVIPVRCYT